MEIAAVAAVIGITADVAAAIPPEQTTAVGADAIATEITADAATAVHSVPVTKRAGV